MKYIAHRGIHTNRLNENTYEAFKDIDSSIYIGYEADVRVTKDNRFIIYHDALYKGKLVKKLLYKEIPVLTLDKLLSIKTEKIVLLEIKDFNMDINKFLKILKKYNRNIYIMSFDEKVIDKIYQKNVHYKLGVLNYILNTKSNCKYDFICLINKIINNDIIKIMKEKNIQIFSYGIKNKKEIKYSNLTYIIDNIRLEN